MSSSIFYRRSISCSTFPRGLVYHIPLYWEQGRTSSPLTWPFISWRNAVTTPICSALILDLPWFYPFSSPNLLPWPFCLCRQVVESDTSFEVAMLFLSNVSSSLMSVASLLLLPNVCLSLHMIAWLSKTKMVAGLHSSRLFSPSLLVNYKSMGGCRRFAIVLCLTLCVSVCFSALIPLSFLWELFVLFLRCKVVFWTFSCFSLLLLPNCR